VGQNAAMVAQLISSVLVAFARTTLPGVVTGSEGGFRIFLDDPGKVRFPDVALTRKDRLPRGKPFEGHCIVTPELVVEVVSPNETAGSLQRKIRDYLSAGVPMIWVVNAETRDLQVFRGDGTAVLLTENDTLDGGEVLPGFQSPVAGFFA
jgi:Uma2 family endonuclease